MNNEEKIRLVLDVLGVDNVTKARQELKTLNEQIATVGQAGAQAAGQKSMNGQGILTLAYAIDDLQYGLKGIVNNIPQVAAALGLGAGMAGVAGIAAVALNQLVAKHPEWFEWSNKVKLSLKELADTLVAEEEAIKRQKKAIDELGDSNKGRIEDILKLKAATEDLKQAEEQLATDRANRKAAEESAKDPGVIAKEELAKNKGVVQDLIVDTGSSKKVMDTMTTRLASDDDLLQNVAADLGISTGQSQDDLFEIIAQLAAADEYTGGIVGYWLRKVAPFVKGDRSDAVANYKAAMHASEKVRKALYGKYSQKARAIQQADKDKAIQDVTSKAFGGMLKADSIQDFQESFNAFAQVMPQTAGTLRQERQIRAEDEQTDRENTLYSKRAAERRAEEQERKKKEKELASIGPTREMFEIDRRKELVGDRSKEEAEQLKDIRRQASIRNEALQGLDPLEMAVTRRQQAGTGRDAGRNLQRLEQRDMQNFRTLLMHKGMSGGEAEDAARESLRGGESSFQNMAQGLGFSLNSAADGFRASVAVTQQLNLQVGKANAEIEAMKAQLHAMGAGNGSPARPQTRRRIGN